MQIKRPARLCGELILNCGFVALLLAGCAAKPPAQVAYAPPPALPVGHVYTVAVDVPPPVSPRIKFTPLQQERVQQAFNVIGLKSALMVGALSCDQQDDYDLFMRTYQPHILQEQHIMDSYFHKASGPYSGQKMEDSFVTLLANTQSGVGISQGSIYCLNNRAEFDAVLSLRSSSELDRFVTDRAPTAESVNVSSP